jgi:transposase
MNPTEPRLVGVESLADLPVLWSIFGRIGLVNLLDSHLPAPPLWKGPLTTGEVIALWLLFVLSQGDHCLSHVAPWAEQHQNTLSALAGKPVQASDFHDDRLADLLDRISVDGVWRAFESALNRQTIRVYQLPTDLVRIDTTTANSYADVVSEQGILQFGHSKDDPSRPQLKIAAAILDPLGMPLVTTVAPGNTADDPMYVPAIRAVRESLGAGGKTYVGDCKMAALGTRAFIASGNDFYLCPLSEVQLSTTTRQELLRPIWEGAQKLDKVVRAGAEGEPDELVAEGFSVEVPLTGSAGEPEVSWTERRWVVRSCAYAAAEESALDRRLTKAEAAVGALAERKQGKKRMSESELVEAAAAILTRERLTGLLEVTVQATATTREKRAYRGKPRLTETVVELTVEVRRNDEAIANRKREMGWQVYATNRLELGLSQVVWAYRGQYRIENDWSRLKGRPLGLTPMYLQDEERMQGLVHLLSLALRILTLVEWEVRERLLKSQVKLRGLYPGQPGRQTNRPTAELLLAAMKTISVSVVEVNGQKHALLTPLTKLQQELLTHWNLPPDLYERIARDIQKTASDISEP